VPAATNDTADRRTRIADAALQLLAKHGARGLTHRAVDQELELAPGSTSYYFRTRMALLLAAAERLVALDTADVEELSAKADGAAELVVRWLTPERRARSLARIELLLAAARDPEFQFMRKARATFVAHVERPTKTAVRKQRSGSAKAMVALVDGLILHGLVSGSVSRAEAHLAFEQLRTAAPATRGSDRRGRRSGRG
jgi:DNA-binding transcriptional regulator YbjK